ncbi:MAG: serine hydrolase domain-containing protein [Fimbriimonadaceae bacterium]
MNRPGDPIVSADMLAAILTLVVVQPATALQTADLEAAFAYSQSRRGDAMIVRQNGETVFERYGPRGGPDRLQALASGTKTFNGLVLLAAEMDGLVRRQDPVGKYLPQWSTGAKRLATLEQLLNLTSGLGSIGGGLTGPAWADVLDDRLTSLPGNRFQYGQAPFNTFGAALETVLPNESYEAYLQRRILDPIGVKLVWTGRCRDGRPQLGGGGSMTARDWATVGELILGDGEYRGRRVLPEGTIASLRTTTRANPRYGLSCWVGLPPEGVRGVGNQDPIRVPGVPDDVFMAAGAGYQRLYLFPSRNLVVVRLGTLLGDPSWSDAEFLRLVFSAPKADR